MVTKTLAELIAETREKFPDAVNRALAKSQKVTGTRGDFINLPPGVQVGVADAVAQRGREIRAAFPGQNTTELIRGQAVDIQNLFRLGVSTTQRAAENQQTADRISDVQNQVNQINDRVSTQLSNLGTSITDASKAAAAAQGKNNFFDAFAGIPQIALIGGAALLAIVLLKR